MRAFQRLADDHLRPRHVIHPTRLGIAKTVMRPRMGPSKVLIFAPGQANRIVELPMRIPMKIRPSASYRACGTLLLAAVIGSVCPTLRAEYRTLDGSSNNPLFTDYGQLGQPLTRHAPAAYADGISQPAHPSFPNPREISNTIFDQLSPRLDPRGLTEYVWVWGQFLDHDIDHTLLQSGGERIDVTIPADDPVFAPGALIPVDRSVFDPATGTAIGNPRQQLNNITAWIDAGTVYGGRASEANAGQGRTDWLRTFSGGRMKVTTDPILGDLLPTQDWDGNGVRDPDAPAMAMDMMIGPTAFVAGDVRANEHAALTSMHTLFVREHNRLADLIATTHTDLPSDPALRDEEIYQRARKIVGAQLQAVTYREFLPTLGISLPLTSTYDAFLNPAISNEFATAAYRMGHSQINGRSLRLNEDGTPIAEGPLDLFAGFFDPSKLTDEGGIEPLLRGLAAQVQESTDTLMSDGLRNLLFTGFPAGGPVANGTDLAALNIQRGRDHGLSDYNSTRVAYGLAPVTDFSEITSDADLAAKLASLYGSVDEIDLWVGALSEDPLVDSSMGELTEAILADQFERLRKADRLFYTRDPLLAEWAAPVPGFQGSALDWLNQLHLSEIILLNTEIESLPQNVFLIPEPTSGWLFALGLGLLGNRIRRRRRRR